MLARANKDRVEVTANDGLTPARARGFAAEIISAAAEAEAWRSALPSGFKDGDWVAGPFVPVGGGCYAPGLGVVDSSVFVKDKTFVPVRVTHGRTNSGGYFPESLTKIKRERW